MSTLASSKGLEIAFSARVIALDGCFSYSMFPVRLSGNDVHVWLVNLDQPDECFLKFVSMLSSDERKWAAGFRFARHRKRFVVARGTLRAILGCYLSLEPCRVEFRHSLYGKPYLAEGQNVESVQFSVAHSHELALYAFALNRRIGVDVERIRKIPSMRDIAAQTFSAQENVILKTVSRSQRLEAFFGFWTRREAFGKAVGVGLADESLMGEEPACSVKVAGDEACAWFLNSFSPAPAYIGALAVEGHPVHLQHFRSAPFSR